MKKASRRRCILLKFVAEGQVIAPRDMRKASIRGCFQLKSVAERQVTTPGT
jgi:hypothetical protein